MKKAKIEMETLGKLLLLTAFLIIFLLMFKGCKDQMENVGTVGTNEYVCWFSHALKSEISFLFPSACYPIDIEKPQDKKSISILMRKCWWMHGQGEKDLVTGETNLEVIAEKGISWYDIARTCYIFMPKEDIPIQDFLTYLRNYDKSGKEIKKEEDSKKTTWGYIQNVESVGTEAGAETGICFDKETAGDVLSERKTYYIIFYDDRGPISNGARDKIMISRKPGFGEEQTGFLSWFGNLIKTIVKLGSLDYNEYCYDWTAKSKEKQEESYAKSFFDKLVRTVQDCMGRAWGEACICDDSSLDPLNELPRDYSIEFKKVEEKKYKISLLDKNGKVYTENGTEFTETVEGDRLGYWETRKNDRKVGEDKCLPGVFDEYKITKYLKDYYIVYHPNNEPTSCFIERKEHNPRQEDFAAVYLVQTALTGFKKCSEIK